MNSNPPVIWLNGAFGAGKTTIARALTSQIPDAILFDPEQIGLMLQQTLPANLTTADFQDIPVWRQLTNDTIERLLHQYRRPLVVAMTVVNPQYFDELVGDLLRRGMTVHHFALMASTATIRKRLLTRLSSPWSTLWAWRQAERCTSALKSPAFAHHIATDDVAVSDIVATIRKQVAI